MDRRRLLSIIGGLIAAPPLARAAVPSSPPPTLRRLKLYNAHTGESFEGFYRDEIGPMPLALDELSHFLRDHHSGEQIEIDVGVIDFLATVMDAVGALSATVLSAYRTRETNAMLARTNFGVADNSQHIYGRALDIHLGDRLEDAMESARSMQRGGVGWYPRSRFFHLDTGPVRNWTLNGAGFDELLVRVQQILAQGGLSVSDKGELLLGDKRKPPNAAQRLALHRAIAQATALADDRAELYEQPSAATPSGFDDFRRRVACLPKRQCPQPTPCRLFHRIMQYHGQAAAQQNTRYGAGDCRLVLETVRYDQ